jgi:hypothetical protein
MCAVGDGQSSVSFYRTDDREERGPRETIFRAMVNLHGIGFIIGGSRKEAMGGTLPFRRGGDTTWRG